MVDFHFPIHSGFGIRPTIPKTVKLLTPAGVEEETLHVIEPLTIDLTDDALVDKIMQATLELARNNSYSRGTREIFLDNFDSGGADGKSVLEISVTPREIRDGEWSRVEFLVRRNEDVSADTVAIYYVD